MSRSITVEHIEFARSPQATKQKRVTSRLQPSKRALEPTSGKDTSDSTTYKKPTKSKKRRRRSQNIIKELGHQYYAEVFTNPDGLPNFPTDPTAERQSEEFRRMRAEGHRNFNSVGPWGHPIELKGGIGSFRHS